MRLGNDASLKAAAAPLAARLAPECQRESVLALQDEARTVSASSDQVGPPPAVGFQASATR